jgi:hypothetical protein
LNEGALARVVEECRSARRDEREGAQTERPITDVVREAVASVLLHSLQSLATVNYSERSHVSMLAQDVHNPPIVLLQC